MTITQEEFEAVLANDIKIILGDIVWRNDADNSLAKEFRSEIDTNSGHPLFIQGRYNPSAGKLSYSIILRGEGRIYGLDLGADHRNPDGMRVGEKHKHSWRGGYRDKWAYDPRDITETWDRPVDVWRQFCVEAKLAHSGKMLQPSIEED